LKPALEVIFMVQKPMSEKTIVDNVLKWGTGAMNVDGCRIPIGDEPVDLECNRTSPKSDGSKMGLFKENGKMATATSQGRFPANLLVSDDALNDGKNHETHPGIYKNSKATSIFGVGEGKNNIGREVSEGNMGSFSRYFDLGAWAKHHGFLNVPKASTGERDYGLNLPSTRCGMMEDDNYPIKTGSGNLRNTKRKNIHPTVKPVELMGYLIELGCPPKGIVLDPFLGSGTTCVAAKKLNRQYIGIEIDAGYHKLAKSRVAAEPVNLDSLIKKGGV
jgi:site-specific DNA-methyltransferase (adenine-specific)